MNDIHEECGVFGIVDNPQSAILCYYGLHSLQHRGQEGAGILVSDLQHLNIYKGEGLVTEVFEKEKLSQMHGSISIGHVRYSTAGGGGMMNVQPLLFKTMAGDMGICHNGNIVNANSLKKELEQQGSIFSSTSDTEILGHLIMRQKGRMIDRICQALERIEGAFAFLIMLNDRLYAVRDKNGLRPLSLGILPGGDFVVSSETCAFEIIGAQFLRDIAPGEIVRIKGHQCLFKKYTHQKTHNHICAMEYVYFSRPDSQIQEINVHASRQKAGKELFKESPSEADVVIGVPDSSISAAIGYAQSSHIPYEIGLIKNKYIGRTFIQPTQELRNIGVKMKLSVIESVVRGKRVVLIDDSIVRGTTSKRIVKMLRNAGAKEIHMKIASPPFRFPCFYGVDTSCVDELISQQLDVDQLCHYIGADSLYFISEKGLQKSIGLIQEDDLCMACFNGHYVTQLQDD